MKIEVKKKPLSSKGEFYVYVNFEGTLDEWRKVRDDL